MAKDGLDKLREEVASGRHRGAGADIRLAKVLIDAGKRDEALAVIEAAISDHSVEFKPGSAGW